MEVENSWQVAVLLGRVAEGWEHRIEMVEALGARVQINPASENLDPELVAAVAKKNKKFFEKVLEETPVPEVLEMVFDDPTVANLSAALKNPNLSVDQYRRIGEVFAANPRRTLVGPLLRAQSISGHRLRVEIGGEDAAEYYRGRRPQNRNEIGVVENDIRNHPDLARRVGDYICERFSEGDPRWDVVEVAKWVWNASPERVESVISAYVAGEVALARRGDVIAAWLRNLGPGGEAEVQPVLVRRVEEARKLWGTRAANSQFEIDKSVDSWLKQRNGVPFVERLETIIRALRETGEAWKIERLRPFHEKAELKPGALSAVRADEGELYRMCGLYTSLELVQAGLQGPAVSGEGPGEMEEDEAMILFESEMARYAPRELALNVRAALGRKIEREGLAAFMNNLPVEVALGLTGVRYGRPYRLLTEIEGEKRDLGEMLIEYLRESIGGDPEAWERFAVLASGGGGLTLGALLSFADG